jgi:hypothetical protein
MIPVNNFPCFSIYMVQNSGELNRNLLYWYFQENQCLNIKKHAVHNIHRLTWLS